jgi:hypothetical protein
MALKTPAIKELVVALDLEPHCGRRLLPQNVSVRRNAHNDRRPALPDDVDLLSVNG